MKKKTLKKVILTTFVIIPLCLITYKISQNDNEFIIQGEIDTKDVSLSSKITGRVENISVKEGDIVQKGDILIQLNIPDIVAQQQQAEASYVLAKQKYDRISSLQKSGYASNQALDDATSVLKQTENKLKEISSYVEEQTIVAPITGQVKEISVEESELVGAGVPVITMIDTTDSWIVFNLREDLLSKIKMGTVINVQVPAISTQYIPVKVDYISAMGNYTVWRATKVRGDFDLKTFEIHARPLEPVESFIAGMTVITDWNKIQK